MDFNSQSKQRKIIVTVRNSNTFIGGCPQYMQPAKSRQQNCILQGWRDEKADD